MADTAVRVPDVEKFELFLVMQRLKIVAKKELKEIGIDADNVELIFNPIQIRNSIIRHEYHQGRMQGIKAERLYCELSEKHNLGYHAVIMIVKSKR